MNYLWQERPKANPAIKSVSMSRQQAAGVTRTPAAAPLELKTAFFNYRTMEPGIGYMDFYNMWDGFSSGRRFKNALDAMFRRVASDHPRVLIIDIRNNGGGDDGIAGELFRHFAEKPFRLMGATQVKRSAELRAAGKSMIRVPFRWLPLQYFFPDGRQYYRGDIRSLAPSVEEAVQKQERAEPFFAGPVCVLTGRFTFSAAAQMADAVKTYGLAVIVGENTGGRPNSFGNPFPFVLPHSGLSLEIASSRAVRANGDVTDVNSVIPDVNVRTTAEDIRTGFDPVLERAKSCPARTIR